MPPPRWAGGLLQDLVLGGPERWIDRFRGYPEAPDELRAALLLGALALGPDVEEALGAHLGRPDSPAKYALARALGAAGHPAAAGTLLAVVRGRSRAGEPGEALRLLGAARVPRAFPLLVHALDSPYTFADACRALAAYATPEAAEALLPRAEAVPALEALAALGEPRARGAFRAAVAARDPARRAAGALGLGRTEDREAAETLLPLLRDRDEEVAQVAFEAYARLGAPLGTGPLLEAARRRPAPWMVGPLGALGDGETDRFLVACLGGPERRRRHRGARFLSRPNPLFDPLCVCRALGRSRDPRAASALLQRLRRDSDPAAVRAILQVPGVWARAASSDAVWEVWEGDDLVGQLAAARAFLAEPTPRALSAVTAYLARPGPVALGGLPQGADPGQALARHATERAPLVDLGALLESALLDRLPWLETLRERFVQGRFPPSDLALARRPPEDAEVFAYLDALARAHPNQARALRRLWNLLDAVEDRGDRVLDLYLCFAGCHRGGVQRAVVRRLPEALARLARDMGEEHLPLLERIAVRAPTAGPLAGRLAGAFEEIRRALRSRCRDAALVPDRGPAGDLVLVEAL
ncbi:MAG: hypothetical protein Kow0092_17840 [Deferrisomatales bacterium]